MSTKPAKASKPRRRKAPQKVILTFTDTGPGTYDAVMTFKPWVNGSDPTTPAVRAALGCLELLAKISRAAKEGEK